MRRLTDISQGSKSSLLLPTYPYYSILVSDTFLVDATYRLSDTFLGDATGSLSFSTSGLLAGPGCEISNHE